MSERGSGGHTSAHEAYVVPREQKRPPPGERPAPLSEVAGPQSAVTVGYVAATVPLVGEVEELVADLARGSRSFWRSSRGTVLRSSEARGALVSKPLLLGGLWPRLLWRRG